MQGFVGISSIPGRIQGWIRCSVSHEEAGGCGKDWDVLQVWGVVEKGFLSKEGQWEWVGLSSEPAKLQGVHEGPCPTESNKWGLVLERLVVLGQTFSAMVTRWEVFMRRVLELHVVKMVALYTVWVALEEVPGGVQDWGAQLGPSRC